MKQLKDYLHLYLGCEMGHIKHPEYKPKKLNAVIKSQYDDKVMMLIGNDETSRSLNSDWKPILRPLSDMTEEEDRYFDENFPELVDGIEDAADQTRWLLSKHFDLFGLIEAGLAIDKTKL